MATKATYLTVSPLNKPHSTVFQKMFFTPKDLREFVSTEQFKEKFPETEFKIIKETY